MRATRYTPAPRITDLGDAFFDPVTAASFPEARLRFRNQRWAERVGLGALTDEQWVEHFARFQPLPDNLPQPLALRYHGHQFRSYNPQLGDGRGFLFAQLMDPIDGRLLDLGTKGSGRTPWSRSGDGRLTLKGGVREVLATELLEARGVNTSKSFSLIETGESLVRNDEPSPTRSAVLVRLSHSHIRFGTFQRLAALDLKPEISRLVRYCCAHYYPQLRDLPEQEQAEELLRAVCQAKAATVGGWMAAGFVHGVLNTDNMNITGESFDYGPWRFLPRVDTTFTAAYFDETGLYAWGRQPQAVLWNLARLAECLLHLSTTERLTAVLQEYEQLVTRAWELHTLRLLGVSPVGGEQDAQTLFSALTFLEGNGASYDGFLHDWYGGVASRSRAMDGPRAASWSGPQFETFVNHLAAHPPREDLRLDAPHFDQHEPISLVIERVEALWAAIDRDDDWAPLHEGIARIRAVGDLYGFNADVPVLI